MKYEAMWNELIFQKYSSLIKVNENWNTLECLKKMRKQAEYVKQVHTIYVINNNNKLLGTMSLKRLLISKKEKDRTDDDLKELKRLIEYKEFKTTQLNNSNARTSGKLWE